MVSDTAKAAIRTILRHMGGSATYDDIADRGGEALASPLMEMVQAGEIERVQTPGAATVYRLAEVEA